MRDERVDKLAELLVNYSVNVHPGDKVLIRSSHLAEPLVKAVYENVLKAGGFPLFWGSLPGLEEVLFKYSSDDQLRFVPDPYKQVIETFDVSINIFAENNTKALTRVDPSKMVTRSQGWREISDLFNERAASGALRWTLCLFPTHAHAQDAEMSLEEFEDFVFNACLPDKDDPIGYWKKVFVRQQKIIEWLKDKQTIRVKGQETDLTLSIAGRTWVNCACKENVPDGEVFTGPVEDSVNGCVHFTYPAIYGGHEVTGVRLWLENGKVVKATAEKGEEYLLSTLDTDEGARFVGEFAIGTNEGITQFTREILFDEKIAGSFHMALGSGYPETGSQNKSSVHWDMICDLRNGGEIWADDLLLYKNGQFVISV